MDVKQKLDILRTQLQKKGLSAYIVPQTDVHQNEYLPEHYKRLEWLTGFTGSAGLAIIGHQSAAIFVDGRYQLQVRQQTDQTLYEPRSFNFRDIEAWLQEKNQAGGVLGADPWLLTEHDVKQYQAICQRLSLTFTPISGNLIDAIWQGRPPSPQHPVRIHTLKQSGALITDKLAQICPQIAEMKAEAALITQLDSVAWLLNIRGSDIPCVPVPLAFALVYANHHIDLFIDPQKITPEVQNHFPPHVQIYPYEALEEGLKRLGKQRKTVLVDARRAPYQAIHLIEAHGGQVMRADDICLLPKACKNAVEIEGARHAHIKDGIALAHCLAWLDDVMQTQPVTELDVVAKLREYRDEQGVVDDSFNTIAGSGPNGAIVHYRVTPETNRQLKKNELFLLDSGGQYLEGTTDVTRTMIFGVPTAEQKDRFTRVLKGHIQLTVAKFPHGTSGHQLDSLARYPLWQAGLDYAHGTGHGVGSFLSVHEGPQRISNAPNTVILQPGMILSNEPGYYKAGAYGIRIENLVVVTPCPREDGYEHDMLGFDVLTLVPIDRRLIELSLLTPEERQWVNAYHARVRTVIGPSLRSFAQKWLNEATADL